MLSENSLNIIDQVLKYLKIKDSNDPQIINLISECIDEINAVNEFKYLFKKYDTIFGFLNNTPYCVFLNDCNGFYLIATTLGYEIEKQIKYLSRVDNAKMVIYDCVASIILEEKADEFEKKLGNNLTYRFCPGYQKSDILDTKLIADYVEAYKIGIEVLDSGMMIPQKSMVGIVGIKKK